MQNQHHHAQMYRYTVYIIKLSYTPAEISTWNLKQEGSYTKLYLYSETLWTYILYYVW